MESFRVLGAGWFGGNVESWGWAGLYWAARAQAWRMDVQMEVTESADWPRSVDIWPALR